MCLTSIDKGAEKRRRIKALEILSDGYVWLWKVFCLDKDDCLVAQFNNFSFYEGLNTAKGEIIRLLLDGKTTKGGHPSVLQYQPGFHCFATRKDADYWSGVSGKAGHKHFLQLVKVHKNWITGVGGKSGRTIFVCKHIII